MADSPAAMVVWSAEKSAPAWFSDSGFEEISFDSPDDASFAVGTARLAVDPEPLPPGIRLFAFDDP